MANRTPITPATPMEKITNADMRKHTFTMEVSVNGVPQTGEFTAHLPSVMERVSIGVKRAQMLGGAPTTTVDNGVSSISAVDPFTDDLAFMIAFLDSTLEKRPKWFVWDDISEVSDVRAMFTEVSTWVNSFHRKPETPAGEGKDGSAGQPTVNAENLAGDEDV